MKLKFLIMLFIVFPSVLFSAGQSHIVAEMMEYALSEIADKKNERVRLVLKEAYYNKRDLNKKLCELPIGLHLVTTSDNKYLLVKVFSEEKCDDASSSTNMLSFQRSLNYYGVTTRKLDKRIIFGMHDYFQNDDSSRVRTLERKGSQQLDYRGLKDRVEKLETLVRDLSRELNELRSLSCSCLKSSEKQKKRKREELRKDSSDSVSETEGENVEDRVPQKKITSPVASLQSLLLPKKCS